MNLEVKNLKSWNLKFLGDQKLCSFNILHGHKNLAWSQKTLLGLLELPSSMTC